MLNVADLSTWHFIKQAFSDITNLDGRFYKSFGLLLKRPGYLANAYFTGRRQPYLKPLQMFLIANLIYFLVQPLTSYNTLNTTLNSHMYRQYYSEDANIESVVKERIAREGISFEQFELLFNQRSSSYAKSFIFIQVPLFALLLFILFGRSRGHYIHHLIFSLHYYAFVSLYVYSAFLFIYGWSLQGGLALFLRDYIETGAHGTLVGEVVRVISELSTQPLNFIYLYLATRRFYNEPRIICLIKSGLLTFSILYIIFLYRYLLFWITFYSV